MLIRNRKVIDKAMRTHAASRKPLRQWIEIVEAAQWQNIIEARKTWPTAGAIKGTPLTCFDIGGNKYRLISIISYRRQEIHVDEVLTHSEYDKKYGKDS